MTQECTKKKYCQNDGKFGCVWVEYLFSYKLHCNSKIQSFLISINGQINFNLISLMHRYIINPLVYEGKFLSVGTLHPPTLIFPMILIKVSSQTVTKVEKCVCLIKESMLTYYIFKLLEVLGKYLGEHDINRRISKHHFVLMRCVAVTCRLNCTLLRITCIINSRFQYKFYFRTSLISLNSNFQYRLSPQTKYNILTTYA